MQIIPELVLRHVEVPHVLYLISQLNRHLYKISLLFIKTRRQLFLKEIKTEGERYCILPNGKKEGLHEIYKEGKLYETCDYINGLREKELNMYICSDVLKRKLSINLEERF